MRLDRFRGGAVAFMHLRTVFRDSPSSRAVPLMVIPLVLAA